MELAEDVNIVSNTSFMKLPRVARNRFLDGLESDLGMICTRNTQLPVCDCMGQMREQLPQLSIVTSHQSEAAITIQPSQYVVAGDDKCTLKILEGDTGEVGLINLLDAELFGANPAESFF